MAKRGETVQAGLSERTTTEGQGWNRYEEEKRTLCRQGLSPKEYERQVKALAARLGR